MDFKNLKDPIYGYIAIPNDVMGNIVDTAVFQRLRHITQTSYAPLYASALHNRFVHSLGVYHLGVLAGQTLKEEIKKYHEAFHGKVDRAKLDVIFDIFTKACLLHDVGHAPFSHTGEVFYAPSKGSVSSLHAQLAKLVNDKDFADDIPKNAGESAKNHEIVSAIIGITEFRKYLNEDKAFFARCITGYQYKKITPENSIKNCFISLLNSKLIDVDKLDYLIRDSYITGYDTVKIDYVRLLKALTVFIQADCATLVYRKGALSVIENVVYAHDSERKWIQTHPVILYENYLLNHSFAMLENEWKKGGSSLFSLSALSSEGVSSAGRTVRLLDDNDILSMMKEHYDDPLVKEFFERRSRRHPIWKSEAEYKARLIKEAGDGGKILEKLENYLKATAKYLDKSSSGIIDGDFINTLEKEIEDVNGMPDSALPPEIKKTLIFEKQNILKVAKCLVGRSSKDSFVLLKASPFSSGFRKFAVAEKKDEIKIVLSDNPNEEPFSFNELVVSLDSRSQRESFFYLYSNNRKSVIEIANSLISCACPPHPKSK